MEAIETTTVAPAPMIPRRWRAFLVPRRLIYDGHLRTLSPDALRVYLYLSHKSYRHLDENVRLSLWELDKVLGLEKGSAAGARIELKDAGLIDFHVLTDQVGEYLIARDIDRWTSKTTIEPCH